MSDGGHDGGTVGNVVQLQVNLTRLVASQIPIHWTRAMMPFETADAADYADTAVELALAMSQGKGARPRGRLGFVIPVGLTKPKPPRVLGDPIRSSLARVVF